MHPSRDDDLVNTLLTACEQTAAIFIPLRPQTQTTTPEAMFEWIKAWPRQHDGRLYFRMSEVDDRFAGTAMFYHIVVGLYREGMAEVERWRLEKLGPKKPRPVESYKNAPSPWDQMELVYVVRPLAFDRPIRFECYAEQPTRTRPVTPEEREHCFVRAGGRCTYCRTPIAIDNMAVDHAVPKSRGGSNDLSNLVASCGFCNNSKGIRTPEEFMRGKQLSAGGRA